MNYVSSHDPVSLLADPLGYAAALCGARDDVTFLPAKSWGPEHGFVDTYFDVVKDEIKYLKGKYGF